MQKEKDRRYYITHMWYWLQGLEKFIKKRTVLVFAIVSVIAVLFYYYFKLWGNQSAFFVLIFKGIVNFFGIEHIRDEVIKDIIVKIISSLTIIISLLSAIYVFTHREQKSISPSASTDNYKNMLVTCVICSMIFNIIFGCLIINEYNRLLSEPEYIPSLIITKNLFSKIIFLCLSLILLVCLVVKFIKYLYKTMSVDSMLKDSVEQAEKALEDVIYTYRVEKNEEQSTPEENKKQEEHRENTESKESRESEKQEKTEKEAEKKVKKENKKIGGLEGFLIQRYRRLHFNFESVFQNLKFAAEHNMNQEFEDNIGKFKETVIDKLKGKCDKYDDINDVHDYLLTKDEEKFIHVYNSVLRSNLALASSLMKDKRYNKAKEVVALYFYMYIHDNRTLRKIFQLSINDFLDFIDTDDERQLSILLDGISMIPKQEALLIYKFLLMKMVNKNQLKNLTNAVYAFKNENDEESMNKNSVIVILLQNLIKSIEISNYQISGFLVKFLITNYLGDDINRGLLVLKKDNHSFSSVLEKGEKIKGVNENGVSAIKINEETWDYCYKKSAILLYGQHVYSINQKLWFASKRAEKGEEIKLREEFKNCSYSEYILKKTKVASSKYGLLFFEDEPIMEKIHDDLNLNHLITKEEMQVSS
ncbi:MULTISPECIES: hypothetical protein [Bacillus]|uniref:hypothetical protein n=1 Tax=Bacillus TaxID=1386 RepID=UPI00099488FD|nr:hypothetical protein [Bacillus mycoides]HDR7585533.1 hypothetical protein [Bacillus mycoides]